jgi:hypothetical protein
MSFLGLAVQRPPRTEEAVGRSRPASPPPAPPI